MIKKEAIEQICSKNKNAIIISANGFISRDLFEVKDNPSNFYMIGSMGLASSIALGVALKNPTKKIFVFDGDGNILMNLGSLVTIGTLNPKNLIHIIFDNEIHESTGGQPTNSKHIRIDSLAKSANYNVFKIKSKSNLEKLLKNIKKISGPILILIKVDSSDHVSKRITYSPIQIKNRFMNSF